MIDSKSLRVIDPGEKQLKRLIETRLRPMDAGAKGLPQVIENINQVGAQEDPMAQELQDARQNQINNLMHLLPEEVRKQLIEEQIRRLLGK